MSTIKNFIFSKYLSLVIVIAFIMTLSILGYLYVGNIIVVIICGSGLAAIVAWLLTTFHYPLEPDRILPLYLWTLAALMAHIAEEYLYNFAGRMSETFHIHLTERIFTATFPIEGYIIWILGALAILYRHPLGGWLAWFIFIGPGVAEFSHYLFPFAVGGHYRYFPGMYTAFLPMIPGILGIRRSILDSKKIRRTGQH